MSSGIPYRAAGTFSGKSYIERRADRELRKEIEENQRYPYLVAPRQSGKSSLIVRTMSALEPSVFRCALVDLSPFPIDDYDAFWRRFLSAVSRSAQLASDNIQPDYPEDTFLYWLSTFQERLVVFVDEIDVLIDARFKEQFFSQIRSLFNLRAVEERLDRLQIVLSGAAHPSRLIEDELRSPFNVGIEVELDDLSPAQVKELSLHLTDSGAAVDGFVHARLFRHTGGSVYLCQLVLEQLWSMAMAAKAPIGAADVDVAVEAIVQGAPRNVHFNSMYDTATKNPRLLSNFRRLCTRQDVDERARQELTLVGIGRGIKPFRNDIYRRVFGAGGPLDLTPSRQDRDQDTPTCHDYWPLSRAEREPYITMDLELPGTEPVPLAAADAPPPLPFTPSYPNEETRSLSVRLEAARSRKRSLQEAGVINVAVDQEILSLRRQLREGGQLRAGDSLGDGRYLLLEPIGSGGFGVVWRAFDRDRNEQVAIKVLHAWLGGDAIRLERFFRGARIMAELAHEAVVRVIEAHGNDGGYHYFVMDFVAGGDLRRAVLEKRVVGEAVLPIILKVGDTLAKAHAKGYVHRDVKPANILLDDSGSPRLTDFDLVSGADTTGGTRTGAMGTIIYAAPELLHRPQEADARADVYGLGMTAVFALRGEELPLDVLRNAEEQIEQLSCSTALKDVLKRAVAWRAAGRFGDAAAFSDALRRAWSAAGSVGTEDAPDRAREASAEWEGSLELPSSPAGRRSAGAHALAPPAVRAGSSTDTHLPRDLDVRPRRSVLFCAAAALILGAVLALSAGLILGVGLSRWG
ncbi:protein kinase [Sorangium sp. So ce1014]|uniref:protein kinase domain-containing protein n=1 Tax=Sorangium sp. So ce1014 TaxID=3133326 RepID=UPI003F60FD38